MEYLPRLSYLARVCTPPICCLSDTSGSAPSPQIIIHEMVHHIFELTHLVHGAVSCYMPNGKQVSLGPYCIVYLEFLRGEYALSWFIRYWQVCQIKWNADRNHVPKNFVVFDDWISCMPCWKPKIGSKRDSETRTRMGLCRFGQIWLNPMENDIGFDDLRT